MIYWITLYGFIGDEMNNNLLMGLRELVIGLRAYWLAVQFDNRGFLMFQA